MNIIKLNAIDSTNDYLKNLLVKKALDNYTIVTAEFQYKGKGQVGGVWESEASKNLMCSIYISNSTIKLNNQFDINMIVCLAIKRSLNKFNIFSFYNLDHGARDGSSLKDWVQKNIKKFNISNNITKIKLLCYPRVFGYVFNPLSIFYCYEENNLRAIFYEVKNTFNEQHTYIFKVKNNEKIEQKCKKKYF